MPSLTCRDMLDGHHQSRPAPDRARDPDRATVDFDTAVFSGALGRLHRSSVNDDGTRRRDDIVTVIDVVGRDGIERCTNIERLQFTDGTRDHAWFRRLNSDPVGR